MGFNAMSAPEDAIASASTTRFALLENARRELIFSAHAITIALSKNSAQSANNSAAPASDFDIAEVFFIRLTLGQYGVRRSGITVSQGTATSARPTAILINDGNRPPGHRGNQVLAFGSK